MLKNKHISLSNFISVLNWCWGGFSSLFIVLFFMQVYYHQDTLAFFDDGYFVTVILWIVLNIFPITTYVLYLKLKKKGINFTKRYIKLSHYSMTLAIVIFIQICCLYAFFSGERDSDFSDWKTSLVNSFWALIPFQLFLFLYIKYILSKSVYKVRRIFISYSQKDDLIMNLLYNFLTKEKYTVYVDNVDFKYGKKLQTTIDEDIPKNDLVLGLVSTNSLQSPWMIYEAIKTFELIQQDHAIQYIAIKVDNIDRNEKLLSKAEQSVQEYMKQNAILSNQILLDLWKLYQKKLPDYLAFLSNHLHLDLTTKEKRTLGLSKLLVEIQEILSDV